MLLALLPLIATPADLSSPDFATRERATVVYRALGPLSLWLLPHPATVSCPETAARLHDATHYSRQLLSDVRIAVEWFRAEPTPQQAAALHNDPVLRPRVACAAYRMGFLDPVEATCFANGETVCIFPGVPQDVFFAPTVYRLTTIRNRAAWSLR